MFATDASRVKALRLEALGDPVAHIAFLDTLEAAQAQPEEFWVDRTVAAALSDQAAQFVAEENSVWIGSVTVLHREGDRALLVAVYVRPQSRGGSILNQLVAAAQTWAERQGCRELALEVHEDNLRAQAAYRKLGFVLTGEASDGANGRELEMVRALPSAV
ncbi:GNAT family N-acetyltransferase [Microbacterium lacus]|uniref:GNAT family N-acetyltransferase n=1 Tax=Microbacterium lacus TaxID=415217 RepID=UPI00384ACBA2